MKKQQQERLNTKETDSSGLARHLYDWVIEIYLPDHRPDSLLVQGEVSNPLPLYFEDEGICELAALLLQLPVTCHHRNGLLERHQELTGLSNF